jgi:hypothetical protein
MAHTARVKRILEEAAALSPKEFEELVTGLGEAAGKVLGARDAAGSRLELLANDHARAPRCTGADLVRLLKSMTPDAAFADDIEAAVREMRSEPVTSPWDWCGWQDRLSPTKEESQWRTR